MGTVEIARIFYQYNTLTKAVRESVKYISLYSPTIEPGYAIPPVNGSLTDTQIYKAKCLAAFGNIGCTGKPIVPFPKLTLDKILAKITIVTTNAGSPGTVAIKLVTVTVTGYQLDYVSNFFGSGPKAFNDISATMRQATT